MKKWYMWFILSGIWVVAAVLNAFEQRSGMVIGYNIFAAVLFTILGIAQYFCDKKGDTGKKIMKRLSIAALIIVVLTFLIVMLHACGTP